VPNSSTGLETAGTRWIRHDRPNFERYPNERLVSCHFGGSFVGGFHKLIIIITDGIWKHPIDILATNHRSPPASPLPRPRRRAQT
jgi:hypothetical protein